MTNEPFQITLEAARVNCGLTLVEAAKLFGINKDTLSRYERDSTRVPRTFIIQIPQVYKVPTRHIFFGKKSEYFRTLQEKQFKEVI